MYRTLINSTTAAVTSEPFHSGQMASAMLSANGLSGGETITVFIGGGQTPSAFFDGEVVVLTAAQPTARIPPGCFFLITKPVTASPCEVGTSMAVYGRTTVRGASAFSPASLFASGEQGGWYDFSDMSVLFQRVNGQEPVTAVEQPIGLVLDKRKGLVRGPELATNGGFDSDIAPWTSLTPAEALATWDAGRLKLTKIGATANSLQSAVYALTTVIGQAYEVTAGMDGNAAVRLSAGTSGPQTFYLMPGSGPQQARLFFTATGTTTDIGLDLANDGAWLGAGTIAYLDNFSVRTLSGNHLIQATSAARPVWSARKNLLTRTEDFADAAWTKTATTVTSNAAVAPDGTTTADSLTPTATGFSATQAFLTIVSDYSLTVYVKDNGAGSCAVACGGLSVGYLINLNTVTGAFISGRSYGGGTLLGYDITSAGNGWWKVEFSSGASLQGCLILSADSTSPTSGIYVWGAQNEFGATPTRYQRVTTASDYDTVGFPHFARYDGVDDSLNSAATVDFTATDKMGVFLGISTTNDSATQIIVEHTITSDAVGRGFRANIEAARYNLQVGMAGGRKLSGYFSLAPKTDVLSYTYDHATPGALTARTNGASSALTPIVNDVVPTNTFANATVFTGTRSGTTLFFSGQINQLITLGRTPTAQEILDTEAYITAKTVNV